MKKGDYDNVMPDLTLEVEGEYQSYVDFYKKNKNIIYKKIIDLFREIPNSKKERLLLLISAHIPYQFTSLTDYGKTDKDILTHLFIPYFERNEEYELCSEILELHNRIN